MHYNHPQYGNVFAVTDTYADLRAIASTAIIAGSAAIVKGELQTADGLGGLYAWVEGLTTPDNDDTVLAPADGQPGRWVKLIKSGADGSAGGYSVGPGLTLNGSTIGIDHQTIATTDALATAVASVGADMAQAETQRYAAETAINAAIGQAHADRIAAEATINSALASTQADVVSARSDITALHSVTTMQQTSLTGLSASITDESVARANAVDAIADRLSTVEASTTKANAAVTTEATARSNADLSLAADITTVKSTYGPALATVQDQIVTLTTSDQAIGQQLTTITTDYKAKDSTTNARIDAETLARSNADNALATRVTNLEAEYVSSGQVSSADLHDEATARASGDSALADQITTLNSTVGPAIATINTQIATLSTSDQSLGQQLTSITTDYLSKDSATNARINTEQQARSDNDAAIAYLAKTLSATSQPASINANSAFQVWTNYPGGPDYWNGWDYSGGTPNRVGGVNGRQYAVNFQAGAGLNCGINQSITRNFGSFVIGCTVEADNYKGAGLFFDSGRGNTSISFGYEADSSGWISGGDGGRYRRTFTKLYTSPIDGGITSWTLYAMANWDAFDSSRPAKNITFHEVWVRAATAAEIAGNRADANANLALSQISTEQTTRSDADGALGRRIDSVISDYNGQIGSANGRITSVDQTYSGIIYGPGGTNAQLGSLASRATTLEASVGAGGNLIPNSAFPSGNYTGWSFNSGGLAFDSYGINAAGDNWHPWGDNTLSMHQSDGNTNGMSYWFSDLIAVNVGSWYQISAYAASHRADIGLGVENWTADAQTDTGHQYPTRVSRGGGGNGGLDLNGYDHIYFNFQAGQPLVKVNLVKWATNPGNGDSYAWFCRPQLVQVANGNAPVQPYTPSNGRAVLSNTIARVSTNEGAVSNLQGRTAAYWQTTTVAGNNRAQLTIRADANGGAGVDIVGDVSIHGNLVLDGSVTTSKVADNSITRTILLASRQSFQGDDGAGGYTPPTGGGGGGGGFCTESCTPVLMADGSWKLAGDLVAGDIVSTLHEHTMVRGDYPVRRVETFRATLWRAGDYHRATAEHPFYIKGAWVEMSQIGKPEAEGWAVKIEVADAHTFITQTMTGGTVLNHNKTDE